MMVHVSRRADKGVTTGGNVPDAEGGEATDEVTEARTSSPTAPATEKSSARPGAAATARRTGTATADDESGAGPGAGSDVDSDGDTTTLTIDLDAVLAYGRERAATAAEAGENAAGDAVVLADADGDRTDTISRDAIKAAIEAADRAENARTTAEKPTGAAGKAPAAKDARDDNATVVADDDEDGTAVISAKDIKAAIEAADRAKEQAEAMSGKGRTGTAGEADGAKAGDAAAVVADDDEDGTAVISVHDIKAAIEAADRAKDAKKPGGTEVKPGPGRRGDAGKAPAATDAKAGDATVVADDDEDGTAVISAHDIKAAIEAADRAKEQADTASGKRGDAGKAGAADGARAGADADAAEDDKSEEKQDSGTDSTSVTPSEMLPERNEREGTRKHGDAAPRGTASRVESFPAQQGPAPGGAGRAPAAPRPRPPQGPGPIQRPAPGRTHGPAQPAAPPAGPHHDGRQRPEDPEQVEQLVERGVVERRALQQGHVPERRLPNLAAVVAGGEEEVAGPPEVLAHREAADPADRVRQGEPGRDGVVHGGDREIPLTHEQVVRTDAADQAAVPHETAATEDRAERVHEQVLPVQRHVVQLRTGDPANGHPGQDIPRELRVHPPPPELHAERPRTGDERQEHHEPEARDSEIADPNQFRVHDAPIRVPDTRRPRRGTNVQL